MMTMCQSLFYTTVLPPLVISLYSLNEEMFNTRGGAKN